MSPATMTIATVLTDGAAVSGQVRRADGTAIDDLARFTLTTAPGATTWSLRAGS